jgi:hypothetical protein
MMVVLMAVTTLTLYASIPCASSLSAQNGKGKGVVIRHRTKKMLHIQFDLIDATIPRQLGNDEMFSMKIAS